MFYTERLVTLAVGAQGKEVAELTPDEKFALAFVAGCEIEAADAVAAGDKYRFSWRTKYRVTIDKREGKFYVVE